MAAHKHAACDLLPHGGNGGSQPLLISFRAATRRRPVRARLPERKIASQHSQTRCAECAGKRSKQRSVAGRARAMRQYEPIRSGTGRTVQESADRHFVR
jgi:hypothetical protein